MFVATNKDILTVLTYFSGMSERSDPDKQRRDALEAALRDVGMNSKQYSKTEKQILER